MTHKYSKGQFAGPNVGKQLCTVRRGIELERYCGSGVLGPVWIRTEVNSTGVTRPNAESN